MNKMFANALTIFAGSKTADVVGENAGVALEMVQDDNYTKRARPSIIYIGLLIIAFNYCLVPLAKVLMGEDATPFDLPEEFWLAWGGAVSAYSVGRSMEKSGKRNAFTQAMTGEKTRPKED